MLHSLLDFVFGKVQISFADFTLLGYGRVPFVDKNWILIIKRDDKMLLKLLKKLLSFKFCLCIFITLIFASIKCHKLVLFDGLFFAEVFARGYTFILYRVRIR